ncbi:MAG: hypothetical protein PHG66_01260 [Candidatus Colwellbacteria bacterium]|nr:hypothetical protein [Candidatus Colwellbacteria bacterium]
MKKRKITLLGSMIGMMKAETDEEFDRYMVIFFRMGDKILMSIFLLVALCFFMSGFMFISSALDCLVRFGLGGAIMIFAAICLNNLNRNKKHAVR